MVLHAHLHGSEDPEVLFAQVPQHRHVQLTHDVRQSLQSEKGILYVVFMICAFIQLLCFIFKEGVNDESFLCCTELTFRCYALCLKGYHS